MPACLHCRATHNTPISRSNQLQSAYAKAGKRAKNSVESMLSSGLDAKLREIEDAALAQLASIHQAFKKDLEAVQV